MNTTTTHHAEEAPTMTTTTARQFCSECGCTTTDYTTERIDRRTPAEVKANRPPAIGVFHTCAACSSSRPATRSFRTFELFEIVWDRGSRWTAYYSEAEAQAVIDGCPSAGHVERRTFEVEITDANRDLLQPGCGDRTEVIG
jgi:hypothetical protein